jgi:hypothetical protein
MAERILILGGYGTFGGRLAQLLSDEERLTLIIAGRSRERAEKFCLRNIARAPMVPVAFDRGGDVEAQLQSVAPDILVDASGPFQSYGDDPYRIVRACLVLGINYLDLADSSSFVKGIAQLDQQAKAQGIFVLSGVSSFPVLTAAVVRSLTGDMQGIDSIIGGIAPSPYAGVGLNVIRAIASYAGKPVEAGIAGSRPVGHAFIDACSYVIAPPGRLPLQPIRFSLVDVPDLQLLPDVWPSLRQVWMGAGPVPGILHRALNALAWTVRLQILPSLSPFAGLMYHIINIFRWGEHRGGMFVAVRGAGLKGETIARSWHLVAEGDDGPYIPSMAVEAVIRHWLAGRAPPAGARSAISDLALSDYASSFARRRIYTGNRQESPVAPDVPLYRRLLGEAWISLPEPLQRMHDFHSKQVAEGSAKVERGSGLCARLVAWLFGFPKTGENVPLRVSFEPRKGEETWQRDFADTSFVSLQRVGTGRLAGLLDESFGPFAFGLALVVDEQTLRLVARRWSFLGIPLPTMLIPRGDAYEFARDGRFNFHVDIRLPLVGLIVRYQGWLVPVAQTAYEAPVARAE